VSRVLSSTGCQRSTTSVRLKVINVADPTQPLVELTVTAKATPDVDTVKQGLLDRVNALLGNTDELGGRTPCAIEEEPRPS
jgi:uncharacterized protein (UPF0261 family)